MIDSVMLQTIQELEPADRLELIGILWNSLSPTDPLTDEERALLDERLTDMETHPEDPY